MHIIEVEHVFFKYPSAKTDTIKDISFHVKQGEIFGFLGPSGAGKSTLQKILTGVLRTYSGTVRVFGMEIKNRTNQYYERIGVDFELPNFYGKFTALENLRYFASLYAAKGADPIALLKQVGLENDKDQKVATYSKGMKMRLSFIRSIMHNPDLLFLDEPTSGLDPVRAKIVKDMILDQKALGKTIILTTHNMHDAEALCDTVAFIVDGTVKAKDAPRALRKSASDTAVVYHFTENGCPMQHRCSLAELGASTDFRAVLDAGTLTSIHSNEQTLEDVFIALTGRCLQ